MVSVPSISNFYTNKTSLANKWMSFTSSNSALAEFFSKYTRLQLKKRAELEGSELNNSSKGMAAAYRSRTTAAACAIGKLWHGLL